MRADHPYRRDAARAACAACAATIPIEAGNDFMRQAVLMSKVPAH